MKTINDNTLPESVNRLAGHGYTLGQILEIGEMQRRELKGEKCIPMIEANNSKAENIRDEFFKGEFAGYKISKFEAVHFHVVQEKRLWDSFTGQRVSKASVQIYPINAFDFMVKNNGFVGMITHLIHDPRIKSETDKVTEIPSWVRQVQVED